MKIAVFFILACIICSVSSAKEKTWGNLFARKLGTMNIFGEPIFMQYLNRTFVFPEVKKKIEKN